MSGLTTFEEERLIPRVTAELKGNPEGLTVAEIYHALMHNGITLTMKRLDFIVACLECAGICEMKREYDSIRYIPNEQLYFSTAVH